MADLDALLAEADAELEAEGKRKPEWKDIPGNILPSAGRFARDLVTPIFHPIQTAKALGNTALGAAELAIPGEQGDEQYARAIRDFFVNRYGGMDNIKNTLITDPVGSMADVATLLSGAGAALKTGSKAANIAKTVASYIDPISLVGKMNPISAAGKVLPDSIIESLYYKTVKPKTAAAPELNNTLARTALDHGITPNMTGYASLKNKISDKTTAIDAIIDDATVAGKGVDVNAVNAKLDAIRQHLIDSNLNPGPTPPQHLQHGAPPTVLDILDRVQRELADHPNVINGILPIDKAQSLKRGIDYRLRKEWGKMSSAETNISKEQRFALDDEIVNTLQADYPELATLNKESHELRNLKTALEPAINRIRNRDPLGAGLLWSMTAGGASNGSMGATVALLARIATSEPAVASRLAIALNKAKKGVGKAPPSTMAGKALQAATGGGARAAAFQSGRVANHPFDSSILGTDEEFGL